MKPIVYFFGSLPDGFSSYPQDHTKRFFEDFLKRAKNTTQIVLHRKDNLLYYGYVRKFNDKDYLGICLCLDRIYCDIVHLFTIFDDIIASAIQAGDILKIQQDRKIKWAINKFTDETVSLFEYTEEIVGKLDLAHKTIDLPSADFSISVNDCLDISIEEESDKIIDASKRYSNLYIVKTNAEIARVTSFYNIISDKEKQIANLKSANTRLQNENTKIQRQKENFKRVTFLSIILVLCMIIGVVVYSSMSSDITTLRSQLKEANDLNEHNAKTITELNNNITEMQIDIQQLNTNLQQKQSAIQTLENSISSCRDSLRTSENDNSQLRYDLSSCRQSLRDAESSYSSLKSTFPINITKIEMANTYQGGEVETNFGNTIYSSYTMYLTPKITYTGINTGRTINLKVKLYNPNGTLSEGKTKGFSYENSMYVYSGSNNTYKLSGWGNSTKGHWGKGKYRIEIWYDDVCLKSKTFTIY